MRGVVGTWGLRHALVPVRMQHRVAADPRGATLPVDAVAGGLVDVSTTRSMVEHALEAGHGVLRLCPTWVPRAFCRPGRRLKLHPNDVFALGLRRGGIDERWLASPVCADNGPGTPPTEGMSEIAIDEDGRRRVLLRDAIAEEPRTIIGDALWQQHSGWPVYSKFFDNQGPLPFHIHPRDEDVAALGRRGKPEAYYFPPQLNNHGGDFPLTFFGLLPGTTRDDVRERLAAFAAGDNRITELSAAHRLTPGTGWDVPPGVLHAPGSVCTYEPQVASDVYSMWESWVDGRPVDEDLLWKDCDPARRGDLDALLDLLDWEINTDPDFKRRRFMTPQPVDPPEQTTAEGYVEQWICWRSRHFSAKELTLHPGAAVTVRDGAAYGVIAVQGGGTLQQHPVHTPAMIRFRELTRDEFFVSAEAAREGVRIVNSGVEPLVLLKHFGPDNPVPDLDSTAGEHG